MCTVLFVDDFKDAADALAALAFALGHESDVAYNGASALTIAAEKKFDIIFVDLTLPDVDGRDVCLGVRKGRSAAARIIALAGHTEQTEGELDGFDDCLLKPLKTDDLERLLS
ncbi:response regulator [Caballeronia sp. EK]|uniref:response regulator n=1 Tax=Caballeronia sp. EK TaxID=2767469 RepID=UPI001655A925|nr:response regulator [Caballeronia sp. EK]MBC8640822.1 response regulator [Caballeronia sp. EK]